MTGNRIDIYNETGARINRAVLACIARRILKLESVSAATISVVLVDNREITRLNEEYLSHSGPTDVIAFRYEEEALQGDVFVSYEQAGRQAAIYTVSLNNELARLMIHGLLHLIGHEDDTPARRAAMHRRENRYLAELQRLHTVSKWMKT